MAHALILAPGKQRQKEQEFQASLSYTETLSPKKKKNPTCYLQETDLIDNYTQDDSEKMENDMSNKL
jgi:hypothetical protein